ncbi:MAG TPA: hypothetical protein VL484_14170 [Vicinamibacterales bacterium]|jgi:hypothetical protein|nr:hypothetical protein [Vicinamibacterales bacterium]
MSQKPDPVEVAARVVEAGLCATCVHVRMVENDRGSRFYLCELAKVDPRFARYPRLPVLVCSGWQAVSP